MINRLSRRAFLTTILGAIASNTLLTEPAVADAIEQFGSDMTAETGNPDKIAEALRQARALIGLDKTTARDQINADGERLLAFMLDHFDERLLSKADCQMMLRTPEKLGLDMTALTEEALAAVTDGLVPVAVFNSLVSRHKMPFKSIPSFGRFALYYRDRIIGTRGARECLTILISPASEVFDHLLTHEKVPDLLGYASGLAGSADPQARAIIELIGTARDLAALDASNLAEMERLRAEYRECVALRFPEATSPRAIELSRDPSKLLAALDGTNTEGAKQLVMQVLPHRLSAQLQEAGFPIAHATKPDAENGAEREKVES